MASRDATHTSSRSPEPQAKQRRPHHPDGYHETDVRRILVRALNDLVPTSHFSGATSKFKPLRFFCFMPLVATVLPSVVLQQARLAEPQPVHL